MPGANVSPYRKAAEMLRLAAPAATPGQARGRMLANLGVLEWKLGERQLAEVNLRAALAELSAALGPAHPDLAKVWEDYREVLQKTGKKAEAAVAAERAAAIRSAFAGQTNANGQLVNWRDLR